MAPTDNDYFASADRSTNECWPVTTDHACVLSFRWNSSAMRRWLKDNSLSAGDGTPLHDIAAIEDLQRALAAFSGESKNVM